MPPASYRHHHERRGQGQAKFARVQHRGDREPAADRIPRDGDVAGLHSLVKQPPVRGRGVLEGCGMTVLWKLAVVGDQCPRVRYLSRQGIRQFIDLGSGYPTVGGVHETASEIAAGPRVLYVDYDPAVVSLTDEIVAAPGVAAAAYDLRRPDQIMDSQEAAKVINWWQPVGVLMVAVLHFVSDAEDPAGIVTAFRERMAPRSYLVLSHGAFGARDGGRSSRRRGTPLSQATGWPPRKPRRTFSQAGHLPHRRGGQDPLPGHCARDSECNDPLSS
jgi:S-adenosyl methyltransferase